MFTLEQRASSKFNVKMKKSFVECFNDMKTVYGDSVKRSTVHFWYKKFKNGRDSIESDEEPGRPLTSRSSDSIFRVRNLIRLNRRLVVREMSQELNLSFGSVQAILKQDLKMSRIAPKFMPKILSNEKKHNRVRVSTEMLKVVKEDFDILGTDS